MDRFERAVRASAGGTVTEQDAYEAGKSAARVGPNTINCHFRYFATKALTKAWERGKAAPSAAASRENAQEGE